MHADAVQPSGWLQYVLPLAVFGVVFAFRWRRMAQERPLKLWTLWIAPTILLAVLTLTLWFKPPHGLGWVWVGMALIAGGALGWWRGTTMRIAVDPATGKLNHRASPTAILLVILFVVIRQAARSESVALHADVVTVSDAVLAFAAGTIVVMRVEMFLRARRLLRAARPASAG